VISSLVKPIALFTEHRASYNSFLLSASADVNWIKVQVSQKPRLKDALDTRGRGAATWTAVRNRRLD